MNELVKNVNDMPMVTSAKLDKKKLYNVTQESIPVSELVDKTFKIEAIIPELVTVPKEFGVEIDDDVEMVERLKITLLTDIGVYHSFSVTFNKALAKLYNILGDEITKNEYITSTKMKDAKVYYIIKIL